VCDLFSEQNTKGKKIDLSGFKNPKGLLPATIGSAKASRKALKLKITLWSL
jgi:hypothetical protein